MSSPAAPAHVAVSQGGDFSAVNIEALGNPGDENMKAIPSIESITEIHINGISSLMRGMFDGSKRVEPVPRLVGGVFKHAVHRFPIKGGISMRDLVARNVLANNALLRRMQEAKK